MAYSINAKDHFKALNYTGNGTSLAVTGVGFAPDLCILKRRDAATTIEIYDDVRGTSKSLDSANNNAQDTSGYLTAFGTDGFTVGNHGGVNENGSVHSSWNWKAAGSTSANTAGSINSTVSVNAAAGFSIVTWTGDGSAATIGHGLGKIPKYITVKSVSTGEQWTQYNEALGNTYSVQWDTAGGFDSASTYFNATSPTTTVFSVGSNSRTNKSGDTFIAYVYAEIEGFSRFYNYRSNQDTDGRTIYCGFKPAWICIKRYAEVNGSSGGNYWHIFDDNNAGINPKNWRVHWNSGEAEATDENVVDILSNGFKLRSNHTQYNGTQGQYYVFQAFAKAPLVGTNNVPATARY